MVVKWKEVLNVSEERMKVTSFGLYPSTMKEFKKYRKENSVTADQALRKLLEDDNRKELLINNTAYVLDELENSGMIDEVDAIKEITKLIQDYDKEIN